MYVDDKTECQDVSSTGALDNRVSLDIYTYRLCKMVTVHLTFWYQSMRTRGLFSKPIVSLSNGMESVIGEVL